MGPEKKQPRFIRNGYSLKTTTLTCRFPCVGESINLTHVHSHYLLRLVSRATQETTANTRGHQGVRFNAL